MANDTTKVGLWSDADVYYSTDLTATVPADAATAFNGSWSHVGLLDGSAGFESEGAFGNTTDHFGWGGILIGTSRAQWKETKTFTILEDNTATRALVYPGSAAGQISIPTIPNILLAFETRRGGIVRRVITKNYAQVAVSGTQTVNEDDVSGITLIATIFPDSAKILWTEQSKPTVTSIALLPLTLALTTGLNKFVVATATYSDSTTANISAQALWTSSAVARATVVASSAGGVVSWVSAGTTNVTCTFGGVTATAVCVVTCT